MTVLACGLCLGTVGCDKAESEASSPGTAPGVPVDVVLVRAQALRETVRGVGTLRACETVEVKPEIPGVIAAVHFSEGSEVEAGQPLFSIDQAKLAYQLTAREAARQAAQARLDNAKREFDRLRKLIEQGRATWDENSEAEALYRAAKAQVERAQAEVQLAQERLDDARLVAPFAGVISERFVDVGDYVKAGDHLATLYRVSQMEIAFTLPERYMGRAKSGQPVSVRVAAYPDRPFAGPVYFVSPEVDQATRDFLVKARLDNPEGLLKPGAFGTAVVTLEVHQDRPVVPEEALVATREGYVVFVVNDDVVRRRAVRVGLREAGLAEVREGLAPGERVVRAGQMNLFDGAKVQLVGDQAPPTQQDRRFAAEPDQE